MKTISIRQTGSSNRPLAMVISMAAPDQPFDPIDVAYIRMLKGLSPGKRLLAMVDAHDLVCALIRGRLRQRYPHLSTAEINMLLLEEVTDGPVHWPGYDRIRRDGETERRADMSHNSDRHGDSDAHTRGEFDSVKSD